MPNAIRSARRSASTNLKTKLLCGACSKTFTTVSNLNKHRKYDCKKSKEDGTNTSFQCRRCGEQFTRDFYRLTHEKERCKRRGSRGSSGANTPRLIARQARGSPPATEDAYNTHIVSTTIGNVTATNTAALPGDIDIMTFLSS